jgi:hypothetical protein
MKLFYFITAHKNPEQLSRLIRALNSGDCKICIHVDLKSDLAAFREHVKETADIYFLKTRTKIFWGGFSQVKATLMGLKEFEASDCTHFVFLSGQDFPIKPLQQFNEFLSQHPATNFITINSVRETWKDALYRVERFHFVDFFEGLRNKFRKMRFLVNKCEGALNVCLKMFGKRKLPNGFELYGGSSWFVFNNEMCSYIFEFLRQNPSLKSFFKYTANADEHFFHTLIGNSPMMSSVTRDDFRLIKFPPNSNNPEVLTIRHWEEIRSCDKFFARKFDTSVDKNILDKIEMELLNSKSGAK